MENLENIQNIDDTIAHDDESVDNSETALEQLIAEAERRGYERRSRELEEQKASAAPHVVEDDGLDSCPAFLSHLRPGFWDN